MVENCEVRGMTHMSSSPCFNQLSSSTCIGEEPQWHCSLRSSGHTQPALLFLIKHFYWALVLGLNVFIYYFISCSGFSGSLATTSYWTKGHHDWFDFFSELTVPKPHSHCFPLVSAYFCCFDLSKVTCAAGEDMVYKLWRQAGFFLKKWQCSSWRKGWDKNCAHYCTLDLCTFMYLLSLRWFGSCYSKEHPATSPRTVIRRKGNFFLSCSKYHCRNYAIWIDVCTTHHSVSLYLSILKVFVYTESTCFLQTMASKKIYMFK